MSITSILSYPERGSGGDNRYRGNCSPKLIADLLGFFRPAQVCDYMCGSGTTADAAASLGMNGWQQLRFVIAPQALRLMAPPLAGQCISVFKETALASAISLPELTFQSLEVMAVSRMTFELWLVTALLYLGVSCFWSVLGRIMERRTRR